MIKVLFFAQVRELVGTGRLTVDADYARPSTRCARGWRRKGDRWALALE